ncbi:MAG: DUF433 domain-containing protein [Gemmatimonadetes bacterium]|nr:DUF433 domain-containing protein [Gemmatimonadota bacterium]
MGRSYPAGGGVRRFSPLIRPAGRPPPVLSFWNLIEAHVLRALRTEHGVSVRDVRRALRYAEGELRVERLLLRQELCSHGGELFLERYGDLISLSASGQIAMKRLLQDHLKRVDWDEWQFPVRLYPFPTSEAITPDRPIAIDPTIAFGRPVLVKRGVTTEVIAERIDVGESVEELAADYDVEPADIEQAVVYERAG